MHINVCLNSSEVNAVRNLISKIVGHDPCETHDSFNEVSLLTYSLPRNEAGTIKVAINTAIATKAVNLVAKNYTAIEKLAKSYVELVVGLIKDGEELKKAINEVKAEKAA